MSAADHVVFPAQDPISLLMRVAAVTYTVICSVECRKR